MRNLLLALCCLALCGPALASETGEQIVRAAYGGALVDEGADLATRCESGEREACFGAGLASLVDSYQGLSQALYRHGATIPHNSAAALVFGFGMDGGDNVPPANPAPEKLTYEGLRAILEETVSGLDRARGYFEQAGESGDYVVMLDPLRLRLDLDGDGVAREAETLGPLLRDVLFLPETAAPSAKQLSKGIEAAAEAGIGFDRADALWFAGYTQIVAAPLDWALAHDFSGFFDVYLHRVFPGAGLPMQDYAQGGTLFLGASDDAGIADMIAALHMLRFPVTDSARLAGVLDRLKAVPMLSRRNWAAILAETDDDHELIPSPTQTSLVPGQPVTQEIVDAWMATLDTLDRILDGKLLVPHWRFGKGFDLKAYFTQARETDLVLLLTGSAALPYLKDGPIADPESFAAGNRVFGDRWPNFALWFN